MSISPAGVVNDRLMLYLAGIVITIFLAVLLAGKRHKTAADRILVAWLCVIAFHLALFYLFITGRIYNYPALLGIDLPYPLLHGPLLFLYTAELTGQQSKYKGLWLLHFLPAIIIYLALFPFFNLPPAEKISIYRNKGAGYEGLLTVCFISILLSGIAYVAASLLLLRRFRKTIKNEFSNIERINLAWLRYLVYGIAVIWIAVILGDDTWVFGSVVVFVFILGFFGIRQVGIFTGTPPQVPPRLFTTSGILPAKSSPPAAEAQEVEWAGPAPVNSAFSKVKYEKSGLDPKRAEMIYRQLVDLMTDQMLFTDPDLTLAALAKTLDVHPNHLSQVINSYTGRNFYDFVNFHRVEEFKKLAPLPGNRNYTLLSLAFECGFNSKTSFNRNFKKATGLSPTEYLDRQNISLD